MRRKWGTGSVQKTASGRYRARVRAGGRQRSATFDTRELAQAWLRKSLRAAAIAEHGLAPSARDRRRCTFEAAAESLLEWLEANPRRTYTERTLDSYRVEIGKVLEYWQGWRLEAVQQRDFDSWVASMRSDGLASSTIRHRVDRFSQLYRLAIRHRLIPSIPFVIERPRLIARSRRVAVPEPDVERLEAAARDFPDPQPGAILFLAADAGLRASEIARLRWLDVDLDAGTIHVAVRNERDRTKSGRARTIPILTDRLRDFLTEQRRVTRRDDDNRFVVEIRKSRSAEAIRYHAGKVWRTVLDGSAQVHRLRHRFETWVVTVGRIDVFTTMRLMGHQSADVSRSYFHGTGTLPAGTIAALRDSVAVERDADETRAEVVAFPTRSD